MIASMITSIAQAAQGISDANADRMVNKAMERTEDSTADGIGKFDGVNRAYNRGIAANILTGNVGKAIGLFGAKRAARREMARKRNAYNSKTIDTAIETQDTGLKDGGKVAKGKGTTPTDKGGQLEGNGGPKDDAIPASLNKGDVVIPADADPDIVSYIMERLGLDKPVDQQDVNDGQGTSVNLSNGETIIPAAYVGEAEKIAQELGTSLAELMPNAKSEIDENGEYATGLLDAEKLPKFASSTAADPITGALKPIVGKPTSTVSDVKAKQPTGMGVQKDIDKPYGKLAVAKTKDALSKMGNSLKENPDTALAIGQMIAGSVMAMNSGSRPKVDLSGDYGAIAQRASNRRKAAISKLKVGEEENAQEKYRVSVDNATRMSPGGTAAIASAQEAAGELASDKNKINRDIATTELGGVDADANLEARVVEAKRDTISDRQVQYDKKMDAASNLISTGMENVQNNAQYKRNRKALELLSKLRDKDPLKDSLKD